MDTALTMYKISSLRLKLDGMWHWRNHSAPNTIIPRIVAGLTTTRVVSIFSTDFENWAHSKRGTIEGGM
jgi:hypothetical protein